MTPPPAEDIKLQYLLFRHSLCARMTQDDLDCPVKPGNDSEAKTPACTGVTCEDGWCKRRIEISYKAIQCNAKKETWKSNTCFSRRGFRSLYRYPASDQFVGHTWQCACHVCFFCHIESVACFLQEQQVKKKNKSQYVRQNPAAHFYNGTSLFSKTVMLETIRVSG